MATIATAAVGSVAIRAFQSNDSMISIPEGRKTKIASWQAEVPFDAVGVEVGA